MLTVAIGTFSSVVEVSIERSQTDVSWRDVGADYRIESRRSGALDPVSIWRASRVSKPSPAALDRRPTLRCRPAPGHAARPVRGRRSGRLRGGPGGLTRGASAVAAVRSTCGLSAPRPGTAERRSRRAVDAAPARETERIPDGSLVEVTVRGQAMTFRGDRGRATSFPGIPAGEPFVVAPYASIVARPARPPLQPNVYSFAAPQLER